MHKFQVALSFAGEQRAQVKEVASCLRSAGVSIFYDDYEKVDMWGKNLYDHLSNVYQHEAQYCLMFVSKDYADKVWTNLERQIAQARALQERGNEYILPVRFDNTEIQGVPSTVFYLDYGKEGSSGICSAMLAKLGLASRTSSLGHKFNCTSSDLALINVNDNRVALPRIKQSSWGQEITLVAEGDEYSALFGQLRNEQPKLFVAHGLELAEAKLISATRDAVAGNVSWQLGFRPLRTDFSNTMEMGSGDKTADDFAKMRARRALLNENPVTHEISGSSLQRISRGMNEALIQGVGNSIGIERSKLPSMWKDFSQDPMHFLETAWIVLVYELKLSSTVELVESLELGLEGSVLTVHFEGLRKKLYANRDPYRISIEGKLDLAA